MSSSLEGMSGDSGTVLPEPASVIGVLLRQAYGADRMVSKDRLAVEGERRRQRLDSLRPAT